MKYKKVVAVLLAVGCIGLVGTLGYFLGQTNQKGPDVKQVVAPVAERENTKQESRKIAVVNLINLTICRHLFTSCNLIVQSSSIQ